MRFITAEFINGIIKTGQLTVARHRAEEGTALPRNMARWDRFSSWTLICEEILDTEHALDWYDDIYAELIRRRMSHEQIDNMRRFAWKTAGWLNYDKMLWEWVNLDERDIRIALDMQLQECMMTPEQYEDAMLFIENPHLVKLSWIG